MLIEVMDKITEHMEDNKAATVLSAIDFSKAFNRLKHQKCLKTLSNRGASTKILSLIAALLTGRQMTVMSGAAKLSLRPVNAGAPQGPVLGCYLFNMGVDDLEENFIHHEPLSPEQIETRGTNEDFPACLTPVRASTNQGRLATSPIQRSSDSNFELVPRVANVPPWIRKPKDLQFREIC